MSVLAFRLQTRHAASSEDTAMSFISALVAHDFHSASALLAPSFSWFGETMRPQQWTFRAQAALANVALSSAPGHVLEGTVLAAIESELALEIFDGPVSAAHTLHIFTIDRAGTPVSVGILTATLASGETVIERVIDLLRFKARFAASAA
jgi:hypothetical protein